MAGDWIKLELTTPDKPEVHVIADTLGVAPELVVGCLARIWIWADQQSVNGNAMRVTKNTLDAVARHAGFAEAMKIAGWLSGEDGRLSFPRFDRHNGESTKKRALASKRQERWRRRSVDVHGVTKTSTREEKRREELTSTPLASSDLSLSAGANGKDVAYIPLIDGTEFPITPELISEFDRAYPAVDCKQTIQEIRAWCLANPKNRKTRTGALRFINSWLSREQNKAR